MKDYLIRKIKKKKTSVTIVGLGYVGLPLAKLFHSKKFKTYGIDLSNKLKNLRKQNKWLEIYSDYKIIKKSDVIVYTLPTPLDKNFKPDLRILKKSIASSLKYFKEGQLVVIESTSYPGTTREISKSIKNKFEVGNNFFIAFSSERIDPGNKKYTINKIPKIISGYTENCCTILEQFYKNFFSKVKKAASLEIAEMSKIFENVFRAVNISLVNEVKEVSEKLNINFHEVNNLASTKPFGFMKFTPSIGAGGHCIPIDPVYLKWKLKKHGLKSTVLNSSIKFNRKYSNIIIKKIKKILIKNKIFSKNNRIIILGLSYKKDIDDIRHSPSYEIFSNLQKYVNISYNDPLIKSIKLKNKKYKSIKFDRKLNILNKFSAIIFLVNHTYYNQFKNKIIEKDTIIIDGTNTFKSKKCIQI